MRLTPTTVPICPAASSAATARDSALVRFFRKKISPLPSMRPGVGVTLSTFTRLARNGVFTTSARMPIVNGNVQPATSYGGPTATGGGVWGLGRALAWGREGGPRWTGEETGTAGWAE